MNTDKEELLRILEAHGKQFAGAFASVLEPEKVRRKGRKRKIEEDESEEEWAGITVHSSSESDAGQGFDESVASTQAGAGPSRMPDIVVFSGARSTADPSTKRQSKAQMKAFMSSKVSKLTQEVQASDGDDSASDDDDDVTNAQNDALLHRLVHTRILSGSLNPELDLTPAQRNKALAGRVLEAAGKAKLGKGETAVRAAERNKAAKRVREGMKEKQKERSQKELEEAKLLGNYHPTLKRLYDASSSQTRDKKRSRGLGMGVGSFRGGILKLSKEEISSVEGRGSRASRGSRGGRGSRGRGGKR